MKKQFGLVALCCAVAFVGIGCGDDDRMAGVDACVPGPGTICLDRDGGATDAGMVVRTDGGDAGRIRPDAGNVCQQGLPCTPDRGCASGECLAEFMTSIGDAMDPIDGLPGGATTIPITTWVGGYCTSNAFARVGMPGACDLNAEAGTDDGCGPCGKCLSAGQDAMGLTATLCVAACTPAATMNPCRMGYTCAFGANGCVPGCASDNACRVYRADTNMNGEYDEGVDRLTYDMASMATCNMTTGRCDHPAAAGAAAGSTCERDAQCEANGECFSQIDYGWDGGYCTKRGCDAAGNECADAGDVCQDIGVFLCLKGCNVGTEPMADRTGVMGHGAGCRPGYMCLWNGTDGATPNNGGCIPGNYNAVATNNVGEACNSTGPMDDADSHCYSPFGYGRCVTPDLWGGTPALPSGICTVFNCAAPGVDTAMPCGAGAQCIGVGSGTFTMCFKNCTTAADCATGYACGAVSATATDPHACVPNCAGDADCTTDRRCMIPAGEMVGRCVLR